MRLEEGSGTPGSVGKVLHVRIALVVWTPVLFDYEEGLERLWVTRLGAHMCCLTVQSPMLQ